MLGIAECFGEGEERGCGSMGGWRSGVMDTWADPGDALAL